MRSEGCAEPAPPFAGLGKARPAPTGHCSKIAAPPPPNSGEMTIIPHHGQERTDPEDPGYGSWFCPLPEAGGPSGPN